MPKIREVFASAYALAFMLVSGCTSAHDDSAGLDCSTFGKTFFSKPTTVQMAEFGSFDVETQYAIFICGNQVREPPAIHLAIPFAKQGKAVVGVLKAKLAAAGGDLTIRDNLLVFEEMSRQKTYDVAADSDLMRVIETAVGRVQDAFWKNTCEQSLIKIRGDKRPGSN